MNPCPTCGRPRLKGAVLDYENNRLCVDGRVILLSPQEADLMSVFVKDPCFTFTVPELADKLWGNRWPKNIDTGVYQAVKRLRDKLEDTSLRIVAIHGHGYGLRQNVTGNVAASDRVS